MALSGSSRVAATSQNDLIFSWTAVQNQQDNTAAIQWNLTLTARTYGRIDASPGSGWALELDGQSFSGTTSIAIGNNETKTLASGTVTLACDADGGKSFQYTFSQDFHIRFGGERIGTVTGSGNGVLDPVRRASQPTASAAEVALGRPVTIYTNPEGDYTHALEYSLGTVSGVIAQGVGASWEWTPPEELARQITNGDSALAVIRCKTYQGDTFIGTGELALSLLVPARVIPTVKAEFTDTSGVTQILGCALQNVSKYSIQAEAAGAYGSTVTGVQILLDGKVYNGGVIAQPGQHTFRVVATDSRGRTGDTRRTVTVFPYQVPQLTLDASRCGADGTADDAGDHARIRLTASVSEANGANTGTLTLRWGWESQELPLENGSGTWDMVVPANPDTTMEISAELQDQVTASRVAMVLSTGYATLDLLRGGRGLALGKSATREGFDCAMPAYFTGGLNGVTLGILEQTPVSGPVLAAVSGGSGWGLYLVPVSGEILEQPVRLAGTLETVFTLRDGCLRPSGIGVTGWVLGLPPA